MSELIFSAENAANGTRAEVRLHPERREGRYIAEHYTVRLIDTDAGEALPVFHHFCKTQEHRAIAKAKELVA